jgi:hypothetical protein
MNSFEHFRKIFWHFFKKSTVQKVSDNCISHSRISQDDKDREKYIIKAREENSANKKQIPTFWQI